MTRELGGQRGFSGSYDRSDVTFLLKPVSLQTIRVEDKERLIQSGTQHYSEMLSPETLPDPEYLRLYDDALARNGLRLAQDIVNLAGALAGRRPGRGVVIASLARAGTPIGVLLVRCLRRMGREAEHYSISIVRDRGIDSNALRYIADRHDPADVVFVDGWTGKGAIATELEASLADRPFGIEPFLAVVADPAGRAAMSATGEDYLIASGLLNAIVSGLVSRSVLNAAVVGPNDFHACVQYPQFASQDRSRAFVDRLDALARWVSPTAISDTNAARSAREDACELMVAELMARSGVTDRNRIKPGIAEATRAVLRRVPDRLYVRDVSDPDVAHLIHLASTKGVQVDRLPSNAHYRAAAVIRSLGAD